MSDIMLYLQQNKQHGMWVAVGIGVFLYIAISILSIVICRKKGSNICVSGMLPFIQLILPVITVIKGKRNNSRKPNSDDWGLELDSDNISEDEEIEF